jgi:hypothetical protein
MRGGDEHYGNEWKGGLRMINLESALESTEESGKNNKADFNPEAFFNQMQTGGILGERKVKKEFKKTKLQKQLSTELEEDDDDFDIEEATEKLNLDVDEDEDTEDLKQKVKQLRAMVSRSKGKAGKKMRKPKRYVDNRSSEEETEKEKKNEFTDSTGGESNSSFNQNNQNNQNNNSNSVSEYLNSTSSISTSDVRLISMNRRK